MNLTGHAKNKTGPGKSRFVCKNEVLQVLHLTLSSEGNKCSKQAGFLTQVLCPPAPSRSSLKTVAYQQEAPLHSGGTVRDFHPIPYYPLIGT